ncbi:MAG TPA: NADH-quinone oxidoreductase subunit A [Bacteroidetes bacterium]|nr:NADH-quinone oxidoreductase subunit A [Bacteroidota bacterium]
MNPLIDTLILVAVAAAVVLVFWGVNFLLGPRSSGVVKETPFETGQVPLTPPGHRLTVRFYLIAILFVIFDVELIFLFPWAVVFNKLGLIGLIEMLVFIGVLFIGLFYAWKRGALEWE